MVPLDLVIALSPFFLIGLLWLFDGRMESD